MSDAAIVLHDSDNVATALADLSAGQLIRLTVGGRQLSVSAVEAVPFGHKLALEPITAGAEIRKYGEVIGLARVDIPAGGYVHVHNVDSQRGRGDLTVK